MIIMTEKQLGQPVKPIYGTPDEIDYLKLQLKEYRSLVRNNPREKTGVIRDEIDRIRNLLQELPVV